jgi:hypothetical protein
MTIFAFFIVSLPYIFGISNVLISMFLITANLFLNTQFIKNKTWEIKLRWLSEITYLTRFSEHMTAIEVKFSIAWSSILP